MSKKPSFIFSMQLNFCLNVFQNLKLASIKKKCNRKHIINNTQKSKTTVVSCITNQDIQQLKKMRCLTMNVRDAEVLLLSGRLD